MHLYKGQYILLQCRKKRTTKWTYWTWVGNTQLDSTCAPLTSLCRSDTNQKPSENTFTSTSSVVAITITQEYVLQTCFVAVKRKIVNSCHVEPVVITDHSMKISQKRMGEDRSEAWVELACFAKGDQYLPTSVEWLSETQKLREVLHGNVMIENNRALIKTRAVRSKQCAKTFKRNTCYIAWKISQFYLIFF